MFRIKHFLPVALSVILLLTAVPVYGDSERIPEDQIQTNTVHYNTETVETGTLRSEKQASGSVHFPKHTSVLYEGETAEYTQTLVSNGDQVHVGDPIAEVCVERDEIAITEETLKLTRMQEDFEIGKNDRGTELKKLREKYTAITDELERQKASLTIQRKETELTRYIYEQERDIAKQQKYLDKLSERNDIQYVTAPIEGVIYDLVYYQAGAAIKEGSEICTIADPTVALVQIQSTDYHYGSQVSLGINSSRINLEMPGTIVVSPDAYPDFGLNTCLAEVRLDEAGIAMNQRDIMAILNSGRYIKINVNGVVKELENVPIVKRHSILQENGSSYVIFLDPDGRTTHKRTVKPAINSLTDFWILQGVSAGDRVIVTN